MKLLNIADAKTAVATSLVLAVLLGDETRNKRRCRVSKVSGDSQVLQTKGRNAIFSFSFFFFFFFIDRESIKVLHGWQLHVSLFFSPLSHPLFAILFPPPAPPAPSPPSRSFSSNFAVSVPTNLSFLPSLSAFSPVFLGIDFVWTFPRATRRDFDRCRTPFNPK